MRASTYTALGILCLLLCVLHSAQGFSVDRKSDVLSRQKRSLLDSLIEKVVPEDTDKKDTKVAEAIAAAKATDKAVAKKVENEATEKKTRALEEEFKKSLSEVKTNEDERLEVLIRELTRGLDK